MNRQQRRSIFPIGMSARLIAGWRLPNKLRGTSVGNSFSEGLQGRFALLTAESGGIIGLSTENAPVMMN